MKNSGWLLAACFAACLIGCSKGADTSNASSTSGTTATGGTTAGSGGGAPPASAASFTGVQAILKKNCIGCHGMDKPKGGISFLTYDSLMKGGDDGPIVTAGDPGKSKIIDALRGRNGAMQMPKGMAPLPEGDIKTIEDWIKAGAKNG